MTIGARAFPTHVRGTYGDALINIDPRPALLNTLLQLHLHFLNTG